MSMEIKGLKKSVGEYNRLVAEYSASAARLLFNRVTGELWVQQVYDTTPANKSRIVVVLSDLLIEDNKPITMRSVKAYIAEHYPAFGDN